MNFINGSIFTLHLTFIFITSLEKLPNSDKTLQ